MGFPSSSLSLVISMVVSAPGEISQVAGGSAPAGVLPPPPRRRGEATGFLVDLVLKKKRNWVKYLEHVLKNGH